MPPAGSHPVRANQYTTNPPNTNSGRVSGTVTASHASRSAQPPFFAAQIPSGTAIPHARINEVIVSSSVFFSRGASRSATG